MGFDVAWFGDSPSLRSGAAPVGSSPRRLGAAPGAPYNGNDWMDQGGVGEVTSHMHAGALGAVGTQVPLVKSDVDGIRAGVVNVLKS